MNTDHHQPFPPEVVHLVVIPKRPTDRWPLRGDYVEVVWAEILGPTAIAIARRLGRAATDLEVDVPSEALTAALAIPPRKALEALRRLHHHRLIEFYEAAANIAVSGWAPSMPGRVAVTLTGYTRHAYGDLEPDTPHPPMFQPAGRRHDVVASGR